MSVVIPVKDAGADLAPLLARLREQEGFRAVDVVIVDSGSTDGSLAVAEAGGARLVRIPPDDFSHSGARNRGAAEARGDCVLFTVQDALPSSRRWLLEMYEGLRRHGAAAVSCGEEPRADADLFYRVISWNHTRFMSPDGADLVMARGGADDALERRRNAQLSDTACLVPRALFARYGHRGAYAEDLDLGLRLIDDGYRLAYLSGPRILHSHNRPAYYHLRRSYVEHLALFDMLPGYPRATADATLARAGAVGLLRGVDGLVASAALGALEPPCAPGRVRAALDEGAGAPGDGAAALRARRDHLDERTRACVARLLEPAAPPGAPADASSARSMAGLIADYLAHFSVTLDAAGLVQLKEALYKGWALHAGERLAAASWRASGAARETLRELHAELTRAV